MSSSSGHQQPSGGASAGSGGGGGNSTTNNTNNTNEKQAQSTMNLALLDPQRWGWTAGGGIADLLPPHERARRKAAKKSFFKYKRKRDTLERNRSSLVAESSAIRDTTTTTTTAAAATQQTQQQQQHHTMGISTSTGGAVGMYCDPRKLPPAATTPGASAPIINNNNNPSDSMNSLPLPETQQQQQLVPGPAEQATLKPAPGPPKGGKKKKRKKKSIVGVKKQSSSAAAAKAISTTISNNTNGNKPIRFSALHPSGVLDIHTYHRGREGAELRDLKTGELLCDVEPTDTNHGIDEPRLSAQVTVKFPLEDSAAGGGGGGADAAGNDTTGRRYYKENITWDLSDPETLTPMAFAVDTAENYGLSYLQTMELAESIQEQLRSFVRDYCPYAAPFVLKDALGAPRDPPQRSVHALYGDVNGGAVPGGMPMSVAKQKSTSTRTISIGRALSSTDKGDRGRTTSKAPAKRKRSDGRGSSEIKAVGEEYRNEVQRRLREESSSRIRANAGEGKLAGELSISEGGDCHLCRESKGKCRIFACGESSHTYCEMHLSERLDLAVQSDPLPLMLGYCPICSLTCQCSGCSRKLNVVAAALKAKSTEQGSKAIGDVVFDKLFEYSSSVDVSAAEAAAMDGTTTKRKGKKRSSDFGPVRAVPKVPVREFPREICDGLDVCPACLDDYRTAYSARGATILEDASTGTTNGSSPAEDCSIDFCMLCRGDGSLVCCDCCPRAYHVSCLESAGQTDHCEVPWKCPACRREDAGIPDEKVIDGSKSMSVIRNAFEESQDSVYGETRDNIRILSMIHEMLRTLMDYDFGYIFQEPVNPLLIPHYSTIIKRPMDLGTIVSELESGNYKRRAGGENFDDIISSVLKDIELVWHNCYTFNCQGSAVYRMATVQRNYARRIQEKCFDSLLSDKIKQQVKDFIVSCELERAQTTASNIGPHPMNTKRKIAAAKKSQNKRNRPVAALDPDTGMVVKVYTTQRSVCDVMMMFLSLNHSCEWDFQTRDMYLKVCRIVKECAKEPTYLVFGYRWVVLDELRAGKVVFVDSDNNSKKPAKAGTHSEDFGSMSNKIDSSQRSDTTGPTASGTDDVEMVDDEVVAKKGQELEGTVTLHPSLLGVASTGTGHSREGFEDINGSFIVKENLVCDKKLDRFDNLESAFADWLQTLEMSDPENEDSKTLETFKTFYLDGVRNVGGIVWKSNPGHVNHQGAQTTQEGVQSNGFDRTNGRFHQPAKNAMGFNALVESRGLLTSKENADSCASLVSPLVSTRSAKEKKKVQADNQVGRRNKELATA